ncbi:MAG: fliQ [Gammaproteobacteria bacterium]|nr:MAG: fliQ [Gammaproteobacteria bacterium]TND06738.1 MAG: fliQ [Gammaproteobacteria bacterium]
MTPETVLTVGQEALYLTLVLCSIILLPALAVGLIVSMFQAATQINEMTLSFIPKLMVIFLVLIVAGPMILGMIVNYTRRLIESIPGMIG